MLLCRSGNRLPAPTPVDLPTIANQDAGLERFEGMLVTISGPLTVTNNFNLGVHRVCACSDSPFAQHYHWQLHCCYAAGDFCECCSSPAGQFGEVGLSADGRVYTGTRELLGHQCCCVYILISEIV